MRTDEWKYVRYPHGDGGPDRHKADLFHLPSDPDEANNLIDDPRLAALKVELSQKLDQWMASQGDRGVDTEAVAHTRKANYGKKK